MQTVAKYMRFSGCVNDANYANLMKKETTLKWLQAYEEARVGPSCLYNKILYLRRARRYAVSEGTVEFQDEPAL